MSTPANAETTVQSLLSKSIGYLQEKQIAEARRSAEMLLCDALHCTRLDLYLRFEQFVAPAELETFRAHIRRRVLGEPVQYILGTTEFYGLPFRVTPDVLIPRPETEHLVDRALEIARAMAGARGEVRILDIGAGSGNIPVAITKHCEAAHVTAIDISAAALAVAAENAVANGVGDRIRFERCDALSTSILALDGPFDLIVSNPPYIPRADEHELQIEIAKYEPRLAYTDDGDGLTFYRRIAEVLPSLLASDGRVLCEIGFGQREDIAAVFEGAGFVVTETIRDYSGVERVLAIGQGEGVV
ncbi:MAG: peptide chain release factor N(5)-glutamine methyltransferase [Ignavibacteria bacterium]|nr:peptide chain release factor N(5)-glutamine methyltransferase [Ignavibacteria bacterium]